MIIINEPWCLFSTLDSVLYYIALLHGVHTDAFIGLIILKMGPIYSHAFYLYVGLSIPLTIPHPKLGSILI